MMASIHGGGGAWGARTGGLAPRHLRRWFPVACLAAEALAVLAAAILVAGLDAAVAEPSASGAEPSASGAYAILVLGVSAALLVTVLTVLRGEVSLGFFVAGENTGRRTARVWNAAIFALLAMAYAAGVETQVRPLAGLLFYAAGLGALWSVRALATRTVRAASRDGLVRAQRIMLVGTDAAVRDFVSRYRPDRKGLEIVGSVPVVLGDDGRLAATLRAGVEQARRLRPDDVYIALPWSETALVDRCLDAFLAMPVSIHLAPERVLDRFERVSISRRGEMASLQLTRPTPLLDATLKRAMDVALAGAAILALFPLFALTALLIRLDSRGPVLFRQTRFGLNQEPFRIFKFRTMTCFEDAGDVRQAVKDDLRVTRVGRFLRRTNLDELPQLLNVLVGDMSLVGPRPHAVPHNRTYEERIALYARRHNVRPGITGWAQVHGLRGETDTDDKMRARVAHDLYYIDNWSVTLDLRILVGTVFSRKAYRNAY